VTGLSKKQMDSLTRSLRTKADKIRALARARVAPAEIARFLGIRYQHAYNVLKRSGISSNMVMDAANQGHALGPAKATVDSFGRIVIPEDLRSALNISAGDELLMTLHGEELRLFTRASGLRMAQGIVSKYLRPNEQLSDELLDERRREVADDHG
jgi:AbrB family looped-hinge helix DNA binding protein